MQNLHLETEDDRELWLEKRRAEKRRKKRSSGSVQKRGLSQSIESDTDDEDLQLVPGERADDIGSSARKLRRKVGKRTTVGLRKAMMIEGPVVPDLIMIATAATFGILVHTDDCRKELNEKRPFSKSSKDNLKRKT